VAATKSALATKSQKHAGTFPNVDEDRQSVFSVANSINVTANTKFINLHKHCLIGTFNKKRVNGAFWSRHLRDAHKIDSKTTELKVGENY
jgi:hypothetical protein